MTGAVAGAVAVVLAGFHAIFFIFHFLVLGHDEFVKICGLVWKVPPHAAWAEAVLTARLMPP